MPLNTRQGPVQPIDVIELCHRIELQKYELIVQEEEARRLRVQVLLLQHDVEALSRHLQQKDAHIRQLCCQNQQLNATLQSANDASTKPQRELGIQLRENERLKAELGSLKGLTRESVKVQEQLALSREVNAMKLEKYHLLSQLADQQDIASDKASLERRLKSTEAALEEEQRLLRRRILKDQRGDKIIEERLRQQPAQFERDVAAGDLEKERSRDSVGLTQEELESEELSIADGLQRSIQTPATQLALGKPEENRVHEKTKGSMPRVEANEGMLKQGLGAVVSKLQATDVGLKGYQTARAGSTSQASRATLGSTLRRVGMASQAASGRHPDQVTDKLVEVPEEAGLKGRRHFKKPRNDHSLIGEKSNFSVTPFLVRTKTFDVDAMLADEGHKQIGVDELCTWDARISESGDQPQSINQRSDNANSCTNNTRQKTGRPRGRPRKVLTEAPPHTQHTSSTGNTTTCNRDTALLSHAAPGTASEALESSESSILPRATRPESRKKRKLAGGTSKTIFDDPDEDLHVLDMKLLRPAMVQVGPANPLGKATSDVQRSSFSRGSFSPLKKDHRGAHASFLP
ncbi:hypothetical protein SODALDRAFT_335250 [Sodiomyces alkalinus F11]|uniref:Uncharacterized protein n=1 Tax=Sodiomyces alkalinus (strain CBS 110278 / VKM F-3762 / F11) TaxID=1314773 RepID=A0A3N2PR95_SODAK|nr:hypothetical protein SODALDRAFT_335250 [Sodiomyces alkalinus F11]ROT37033.1 hypothetical protein SODALDRAFT_335250 [Sodiomyces alkalinus F11]